MKKSKFLSFSGSTFCILLLFALFWLPLSAQDRFSIEFRPGANFATNELGDADLNTGFGFEGTFAYRFMPHLAVYAGWGWNKFSADNSFAGKDMDFEETGYSYGLQFIHPIGDTKLNYLIRAGAITNHIEVENSDGDIIEDSGHGMGFQVELGLPVSFGERWLLTPGIRYRSLSRDLTIDGTKTSVDLNYLSAGLGVTFIF